MSPIATPSTYALLLAAALTSALACGSIESTNVSGGGGKSPEATATGSGSSESSGSSSWSSEPSESGGGNSGGVEAGATESSTGIGSGSASSDGNTVVAALGASCSPHGASASNQPDNPCSTGYIWACAPDIDGSGGAKWFQEGVQCSAGPQGQSSTAPCGPGEVLFVADPSGDEPAQFNDAGLPDGLANQIYAEAAYCVPIPSSCSGTLDCACASATCSAQSGCGIVSGPVACFAAGAGVIDCNCP